VRAGWINALWSKFSGFWSGSIGADAIERKVPCGKEKNLVKNGHQSKAYGNENLGVMLKTNECQAEGELCWLWGMT